VRLSENERSNVDTLRSLLIDTPAGLHVPLEQVANIQVREGSLNISRGSGLRVQSIGVFIRGRDMGSIVKKMQDNGAKAIRLPTGYYIIRGGEFETQERAMGTFIGDCSGERRVDLHLTV